MSNTELLELAERCERATGPDRALDIEMLPLVGLRYVDEGHPFGRVCYDSNDHAVPMPQFTASIDAAMKLVPEGPHGSHWGLNSHDRRNGKACAYVTLYDLPVGDDQSPSVCEAATPALALCAAALKARASQ